MGNLGTPEIFVVLIVALLVLGPNRLPSAARQIGKAMAEFRRVTSGLQTEMQNAVSALENEVRKVTDDTPDDAAPGYEPPVATAPYVFEPPAVGPAPVIPPAIAESPASEPPSTEA